MSTARPSFTTIECSDVIGSAGRVILSVEHSEGLTGGMWLALEDGGRRQIEAHLTKDQARQLFLCLARYLHQMGDTP